MKMKRYTVNILLIVIISLSGCAKKNVKGEIASVPVSFSLNAAISGNIGEDELSFSGDSILVRLSNGKEVKAFATPEQMRQAIKGNNKALLERSGNRKWKVTRLEEQQ